MDLTKNRSDKHYKRLLNLISALYNYVWWAWRFAMFGFKSRLVKPDMLTSPRLISIGRNVHIRKGSRLEAIGNDDAEPKIIIGDNTSIHFYFHCGAAEKIVIGNDVLIAGRVYITDHDHVYDDSVKPVRWSNLLNVAPVAIGDGVWLGEGVVVLKGVTIGRRSVIGANSVVTRDIPEYSIAVGSPAKVVREIW